MSILLLQTAYPPCMVNTKETKISCHLREQRYGIFERSINLPTDVAVEKSKALFEKGILTITLPKAEAVKPKMISIKAK